MLTKEERAEIAERMRNCNEADYYDFYEAVTGEETAKCIPLDKDVDNIANVILDLCDTSNMVELPLDRDGEVIRVGDTVYNEAGNTLEVKSIEYSYCDRVYIRAYHVNTLDEELFFSNELTHKATTTTTENIEAFNEAVKVTAQYVEASMNECVEAMKKLAEVFNRVGGNDD